MPGQPPGKVPQRPKRAKKTPNEPNLMRYGNTSKTKGDSVYEPVKIFVILAVAPKHSSTGPERFKENQTEAEVKDRCILLKKYSIIGKNFQEYFKLPHC